MGGLRTIFRISALAVALPATAALAQQEGDAVAPVPPPPVVVIAGTQPDRRPEGAPFVEAYVKDADWYARALHGVVEPYPASLRWLEDLGPWWSPFRHPGMTGPYDIRGWHTSE